MESRVRILDVAREAGVSVSTVSHALSGKGKMSGATRERIRETAARLGYAPDRIASALRSRRSGIVGLVSDQIATTPFAGRIVLGAQDAAAALGLVLMVVDSNGDPEVEARQLDTLLDHRVDAIIYAKLFHRRVDIPAALVTVPTVLVDAYDPVRPLPSIVPDEDGIGVAATRRLLREGHERIAHVTINEAGPGTDGRIAGYRRAMVDAGYPGLVVEVAGPADASAGRQGMREVWDAMPDVTAVFAFNDPMAMGVYQAANARGFTVPEDLSVVGVDNLEFISAQLLPALTTVALPHYEMGRWAIHRLEEMIGHPLEERHTPVRLDCVIVERMSVAAPREPAHA